MSNPELIKMHCRKCGGGVEFPADGVGQRIACPHCQAELTLKRPVSKLPFLFGGICLILLFVAAAFGAYALWHHPSPAELKAMQIGTLTAKAEAGYDQAQFELATRYFNGVRGAQTNQAEAVNWYRKAAEQGLVAAQVKLGQCYESGVGVATNAVEAVNWYRKAALQGDPKGQWALGLCYAGGEGGVETNVVEAANWYRK